jgi:hypothetical protein
MDEKYDIKTKESNLNNAISPVNDKAHYRYKAVKSAWVLAENFLRKLLLEVINYHGQYFRYGLY